MSGTGKKKKSNIREFLKILRTEKKMLHIAVVSLGLIGVCIVLCIIHVVQIKDMYYSLYHDRALETAEMTMEEVSESMKSRTDYLSAAAATLESIGEYDNQTICETLDALNTTELFDSLYFIMESTSKMYHGNGTVQQINYDSYVENIGGSANKLSAFRVTHFQTYSVMGYCYPVLNDGLTIGYLVGFANAQSRFGTIFSTESAKMIDSILIDEEGNILATGDYNKYLKNLAGKNFYSDVLKNLCGGNGDKAEILTEDIRLGEYDSLMGEEEYSGGSYGPGTLMYAQIPNTDNWMLVFCLFDETVAAAMKSVLIESMITIAVLLILIGAIFVIVGRYASEGQRRMHDLEFVDEVTGSPNENAFKEKAKELLEENPQIPYVVACFDILNFRYINEGYGHEKADILLNAVATAFKESLSYNETFARIGADRFVSLTVDDGREVERMQFIDEKISSATSGILMNYPIRVKTGLYFVKNHEENVTFMIDKAELARKSVDATSRGELTAEYREQLMESTRKQEQIESRMEIALESGEFVPFLQPKWNMAEDHICGAEALVRWINPDGSVMPPNDFIPLFERNGFIEKVDFYMLDRVCAYIRQMLDEGRRVYPVSVNQSRFLMHDPEYVSKVQQVLIKYKIPKNLIELEITETVFTHDREHMLDVMNQLKDLNIELSMDDFGSGYSSLNLLRDIPFDVLKIDRGFLDESTQSDTGKWILRKIVEMADGLNLRVICEGVETQEHVDMLLGIGCIYAQGYKYSKPIPLNEYMEKYNLYE